MRPAAALVVVALAAPAAAAPPQDRPAHAMLRPGGAAGPLAGAVPVRLPGGAAGAPGGAVPQDRSVDPVVLTGAQLPAWSAGPEVSFREPQAPNDPLRTSACASEGDHNCYQPSRVPNNPRSGAPVDRLIGYRWDGLRFVEIPLQVDERFTRYLTNNASGFAFYSGADAHTTYAFDREGFRFTSNDPADPCVATPRDGVVTTPDPIPGLDDNDEVVFLYRDMGPQAPPGAALPAGIEGAYEVRVDDPTDPSATPRYAYVALAGPGGPRPSFDATNGYVRYRRDPGRLGADLYLFSQSSYENYGNAPPGPYCDTAGNPAGFGQRRPRDSAWVWTPRYAFRYEGRWLMTELRVASSDRAAPATAADGGPDLAAYGPDLVDQWKARAFQQRPGGQTPCCGYEEEVNNWGGSSMLLGERAGPVRVIRETWGADSSTNNVRREVFYPEQILFEDFLRVHPIPPLDGIYVQWDHTAGVVTRYYNPHLPDGVPVDGQDDEAFGNLRGHAGTDGASLRDAAASEGPLAGQGIVVGNPGDGCDSDLCLDNDFDEPDPAFSGPVGVLDWEEVAGPYGTLVTRWALREVTLGGAVHALVATPYYRDDSCFDDGTGSDPGPHLNPRRPDTGPYATWVDPDHPEAGPQPRTCWRPGDVITGDPLRDRRFWQGDIGTHGLHLQLIAESDNLFLTVPTTEIDAQQRMVVLPGDAGNVGERYGRALEHPLAITVTPR